MLHIESKTGNSYPIADMTEEHLLNTIDVFLSKLKAVNMTKDTNPRVIQDFENLFSLLSNYVLVAVVNEILNPIKLQEIQMYYDSYNKINSQTFRGRNSSVPNMLGTNLL